MTTELKDLSVSDLSGSLADLWRHCQGPELTGTTAAALLLHHDLGRIATALERIALCVAGDSAKTATFDVRNYEA